jgi:MYXO-CTERM domain-containing protein
MKKYTSNLPVSAPSFARASHSTRKPRLALGGLRKGFEQAHIGLCRGEFCGSSSAKDNPQISKDLRKASQRQSRNPGSTKHRLLDARFFALAASLICLLTAHGVILTAPDSGEFGNFGISVSLSGNKVLIGATGDNYGISNGNDNVGSAYYYNTLNIVQGQNEEGSSTTQTESIKLENPDKKPSLYFGKSVSLSEDNALVGILAQGNNNLSASVYYYKALDEVLVQGEDAIPTQQPEYVKLVTDGRAKDTVVDYFGTSVSLSGNKALVGAYNSGVKNNQHGAAYYYKALDGNGVQEDGEGNIIETAKLVASDRQNGYKFGTSVSLWGDNALIGADGNSSYTGAAYYYKALDGNGVQEDGEGNIIETAKLVASDRQNGDYFGTSVSLWGDNALVGAPGGNYSNIGAAYYYNALDGNGVQKDSDRNIIETAKLVASDRHDGDKFGTSVSLWENSALIGASGNSDGTGVAYYYKTLDGNSVLKDGNGNIIETVKLLASDRSEWDGFGKSVSLSGHLFVIGADNADFESKGYTGKAYAGDIRAFTTLDEKKGATLSTAGLSFISQTDWIIGEGNNGNKVTLSKVLSSNKNNKTEKWFPDTANVMAKDTAVYIGKSKGASNNTLVIEGELTANQIYIGRGDGANNNILVVSANEGKVGNAGKITTGKIHIGSESSRGNGLILEMGTAQELQLTFPQGGTEQTTIVLHKDNYLIIRGIEPREDEPSAPMESAAVAEALKTAKIQLMAGWKAEEANNITQVPENAADFISTRIGTTEDLYGKDLTGYTIVSAKSDGPGTPEPSTYALWGGALLLGLVALRRRRRKKE